MKYLWLLCIISLSLSAKTFNFEVNQTQKMEKELNFYHKLFTKDMGSISINHKIATLCVKLKHYDEALAAFERVRIIDETNPLYAIEQAELYMALKMYGDAQTLVSDLKNLSPELIKRKQAILDYIESLRKKHTLIALINLGFGVDDNVNNSAAEAVLSDYFGSNFDASTQGALSDQYLQAVATIVSHYDVGKESGFYLQNSITALSKNQLTYSDYNLLFYKASLGAGYKGKKFLNTYAFEYDHINYGATPLINAYALTPKLTYIFSAALQSNFVLKYQIKKYIDAVNSDKDSHNYTFESGLSWIRPFNTLKFFYRYQGAAKVDSSSSQTFIDYQSHLLGTSYLIKLAPEFSTRLRYQIRAINYTDIGTNITDKRQDLTQTYTIAIRRILSKHLALGLEYNNNQNRSNSELLSYKKTHFQINANYTY